MLMKQEEDLNKIKASEIGGRQGNSARPARVIERKKKGRKEGRRGMTPILNSVSALGSEIKRRMTGEKKELCVYPECRGL